jgi:hypothetical protein
MILIERQNRGEGVPQIIAALRDFLEGTEGKSGAGRGCADVNYSISLVRMKSGFFSKLVAGPKAVDVVLLFYSSWKFSTLKFRKSISIRIARETLAPASGAVSTDFEPRHEDVKVAIPL